jgi:hypothetical protein
MSCSATVSPDATDVAGTYTITANIAADANYQLCEQRADVQLHGEPRRIGDGD